MKRRAHLVGLMVILATSFLVHARVESADTRFERITLSGLDGVHMRVKVSRALRSVVDTTVVLAHMKQILQASKIPIRDARSYVTKDDVGMLLVTVGGGIGDEGSTYFRIDVQLLQSVRMSRDVSIRGTAATWDMGAMGLIKYAVRDRILDQIDSYVRRFAAAYVAPTGSSQRRYKYGR